MDRFGRCDSGGNVYSEKAEWFHVRRPTSHEVGAVGGVIADSFVDDPIESWSLRCGNIVAAMRVQFLVVAEQACENGWLWTTEMLDAAAIWVPPSGSFDMAPIREANLAILEHNGGDP